MMNGQKWMPKWIVWESEEPESARAFHACNAEEAAKYWCETVNPEYEHFITETRGNGVVVNVAPDEDSQPVRVRVFAVQTTEYRAVVEDKDTYW